MPPRVVEKEVVTLPAMQITVFGDSISLGAEATSWETTFVGIVASRFDAAVNYFCRGGATSETGADWCEFVWSVPPPDLVIVSYGMNDQTLIRSRGRLQRRVQVTPERYRDNVLRIRRAVRARGARSLLLVAAPTSHPDWEGSSGRTLEYREALLACEEPVADVPSLWEDPRRLIVNGMNHPGDEGHRLIADACFAALDSVAAARAALGE